MTKMFLLVSAISVGLSGAALADYKLDDKGKCRDEHNKFAKAELCEHHAYKIDAKGKCRDEHNKFADMKLCHA
jgi:hypothetical protein